MPIYPKQENYLFHVGRYFAVEWFYTQEGHLPAYEHYLTLTDEDKDRLKFLAKYIADNPYGTLLPKTMYRVEDRDNKIYAFKPDAHRFFNFMTDRAKMIITNAYRKHAQQMTKADLELLRQAVRFKTDYLNRVKEGTYYENQTRV